MSNQVTSDNFSQWDFVFIKQVSDTSSWRCLTGKAIHQYNVVGIPVAVKSNNERTFKKYYFKNYYTKQFTWFENKDIEQCRGYHSLKELLEREFENML